ncbi:MAG TPA: CRTAC1 family protein [Thermoanaerobaculia bacterium]|nr:CRTAC1 family protein [Thermoanaerobaculia bacterium]
MIRPLRAAAAALGLGLACAAAVAAPPAPEAPLTCPGVHLTEVAAAAGVPFRHRSGASPLKHLPETMGAGLAWVDYDGDGWLDLYLVQSGPFPPDGSTDAVNRLFRNRGADGAGRVRFEEVPGGAGASIPGDAARAYGQGVVAADVEGDGDTDLLVTNFGRDVLLLNQGDGRFAPAGESSGVGRDAGWSSSAAFADADADGDLDLYVARYVEYDPARPLFCGDAKSGRREYCDPSLFTGAPDLYYRNGGGGAFAEAAREAGLADPLGKGLGVLFVDLDGDLRPEVYVANDQTINLLFANRGGGRFEDVSLLSGTAVNRDGMAEAGMGLAAADFDADGDPDLTVTNFDFETNTLYRNLGGLQFEDDSAETGFGPPSLNLLGFGLAALDLDLDGDLDYYVANGHVFERPPRQGVTYEQPSLVLLGDGRGRFTAITCPVFAGGKPGLGRGLAAGDYDNDGDPDLAVQNNDRPLALLRNDGRAEGWVGVALRGRGANSEGVGAKVRLLTSAGAQTRWVLAGESYLSSADKRALFALPRGARAEAVEVTWPSGARQRVLAPPAGRYLSLAEPPPPPPASR